MTLFRAPWRRNGRTESTASSRSWLAWSKSKTTSVVAGIAVPAILGTLAVVNPGVPIAEVDLNDGAVWVTNTHDLKVGRYNAKVRELNGGVITSSASFDVLQDGDDIYAVEPATISKIDPASLTYEEAATIPSKAQVAMAHGTVAVTDRTGGVWIMPGDELVSTGDESAPDLDLSDGAVTTVAPDGKVYAFDPGTGEVTILALTAGKLETLSHQSLNGAQGIAIPENPAEAPQISVVGSTPVVIANDTLYTPNTHVSLAQYGNQHVLQTNDEHAGQAIVANDSGMIAVDTATGKVTVLVTGANGRPAKPVFLGGCLYGAWSSVQDNYIRSCGHASGSISVLTQPLSTLDNVTELSTLVFRTNRNVIILNDALVGRVWLPEKMPQSEDLNWRDIQAPDEQDNTTDEQDNTDTQQADAADCTANERPPRANNDEFKVRASRATILDVLGNDSVGQCGIIAITETTAIPESFGTVQLITNGRSLQVEVAPTARGEVTFDYTITDGRGANPPSTAQVTLSISPEGENAAPYELRKAATEIEQGATLTYNALSHLRDPDGDPLILENAEIKGADEANATGLGTLRFRKDGMISYIADSDASGTVNITLTVSDGNAEITSNLAVAIKPAATLPPLIDPILRTAYVSQPVEVDVLSYVKSRSTEPIRLASVDEVAGTTINADLDAGSFTFSAPTAGSYYVNVTLVSAPHTVTGIVRIDVREWPKDLRGPVAVSDVALLPAGSQVTIAPLTNDYDPNGGVMVLTGVDTEDGSTLHVGVIEHRFLQISSSVSLTKPEVVHYLVDNGYDTARGTVLVQPVEPPTDQRPPEIKPISVSVRTGGIVTIPVLDYVTDADGDTVSLVRELPEQLPADQGLLFVSGDTLRYQAPAQPRTTLASFQVIDSLGNVATGQVRVNVHDSSPDSKGPTKPKLLTARAYAGEKIRIQIPLTGIDPDGDGVTLLGQGDTLPQQGFVSAIGADWIEYTANQTARATDTFTYAVEDWTGQRALGTIRVGIVARPVKPLPIVAADDLVTVQPGTTVEVRVTRNDVDPSGLDLTLDPLPQIHGATAQIVDNRIVVNVPAEAQESILIPYTVHNTLGSTANATLTVNVSAEATISAPIAKDIVVAPYEVADKTSVEVDVLAVAENPSGALSDLELSIPASHSAVATVTGAGKVTVILGKTAQTIPFRLTNSKAPDAYTYAFISVPALGDFPPVLRPKARALKVASGQEITIPLSEFVQVGPGKTPFIRDPQTVQSGQSNGADLVEDSQTLKFVSRSDFVGTASISFEVWDSSSELGKSSILTIPITVYAEKDYPPIFSPTLIQVPQGSDAIAVDLRQFTTAPDGNPDAEFGYRMTGAPTSGFHASIDGSMLSVSAPTNLARGTSGSVALSLSYGVAGSMPVTVPFEVVASNKTLPVVRDQSVVANAGETTSVDVLAGAVDPVGQGLRVVATRVLTASSGGTSVVSGRNLQITPPDDFAGTMQVAFVVRDALNDPSREVEGLVALTVRKVPDAPSRPRVSTPGNREVTVTWDAPAANGAPIQGYRVTGQPGGTTTACASTTCVISGLTNGTAYRFTVAAYNEVGYSEESTASADITPDILPAAPDQPVVVGGDQKISVTWNEPKNEGSRIVSYTVELSPGIGDQGVTTKSVTGLATSFSGLKNGTAYTVRVRAVNGALTDGGAGPFSLLSEPVVPAGPPEAPSVRAKLPVDTPLGRQINVSWQPNGANGDPINGYTLTVLDGSTEVVVKRFDASVTNWSFTEAQNGVDYRFALRAKNRAGESTTALTDPISSFTAPGAPIAQATTVVQGRSYAQGGALELSWGVPSETGGRGIGIAYYEFKATGTKVSGTKFVVDQLAPGTKTPDYQVRACNDRGACSGWTTLAGATAVTTPQSPAISGATELDGTDYSFTLTGRDDGGSAVSGFEYRIDGGDWTQLTSGTVNASIDGFGEDLSRDVLVEARALNAQGYSANSQLKIRLNKIRPPEAPANIQSAPNPNGQSNALRMSWDASTVNASRITKYGYCVEGARNDYSCPNRITQNFRGYTTQDETTLTADIWWLPQGTYTFKVWAITNDDIGEIGSATITVPFPAATDPDAP